MLVKCVRGNVKIGWQQFVRSWPFASFFHNSNLFLFQNYHLIYSAKNIQIRHNNIFQYMVNHNVLIGIDNIASNCILPRINKVN